MNIKKVAMALITILSHGNLRNIQLNLAQILIWGNEPRLKEIVVINDIPLPGNNLVISPIHFSSEPVSPEFEEEITKMMENAGNKYLNMETFQKIYPDKIIDNQEILNTGEKYKKQKIKLISGKILGINKNTKLELSTRNLVILMGPGFFNFPAGDFYFTKFIHYIQAWPRIGNIYINQKVLNSLAVELPAKLLHDPKFNYITMNRIKKRYRNIYNWFPSFSDFKIYFLGKYYLELSGEEIKNLSRDLVLFGYLEFVSITKGIYYLVNKQNIFVLNQFTDRIIIQFTNHTELTLLFNEIQIYDEFIN